MVVYCFACWARSSSSWRNWSRIAFFKAGWLFCHWEDVTKRSRNSCSIWKKDCRMATWLWRDSLKVPLSPCPARVLHGLVHWMTPVTTLPRINGQEWMIPPLFGSRALPDMGRSTLSSYFFAQAVPDATRILPCSSQMKWTCVLLLRVAVNPARPRSAANKIT